MAKFLPVAPPSVLSALTPENGGATASFMLAHEVVEDPDAYDHHVHWQTFHADILDNSVIELGGAVDLKMIAEAARICSPSVVVLPDVLEDAAATVDAIHNSAEAFRREMSGQRFMVVPQGETLKDWIQGLEDIAFSPLLNALFDMRHMVIGIPRNTTGRIVQSRQELVKIVNVVMPYNDIHLLGFSENMADDFVTAAFSPKVLSIDSAAPLRMHEMRLSALTEPRGNWWNEVRRATALTAEDKHRFQRNYIIASQMARALV